MQKVANNSSDHSENEWSTPLELRANVESAKDELLPKISREMYNAVYKTFNEWVKSKNTKAVTQTILMAYFIELSEKLKPPTLWSTYSMLKSTLKNNDNVDIGKYLTLTAFLKRTSERYIGKKSQVLSSYDIEKFLSEAPDEKFLATKVALIFAISGVCRRDELSNIKLQDIQHRKDVIVIKIPHTNKKSPRSFTVDGEFRNITAKYESLRPKDTSSDRFFLNFQKGKCTSRAIEKNKFCKMPSDIANYLQLPDATLYTGHSFRRTSATLLADSGADIKTMKHRGGWRSSTVAEIYYIEDSTKYNRNIGNQIDPSSSKVDTKIELKNAETPEIDEKENNYAEGNTEDFNERFTISDTNNCTVTITN